jgi:hypothetical protein
MHLPARLVTRASVFLEQPLPGFQEQLKKNSSAKGESSRSSGGPEGSNNLQGEGDYEAGRRFCRSDVEGLVKTADIERAARDAATLNKQEAAEMAAAEEAARKRAKPA